MIDLTPFTNFSPYFIETGTNTGDGVERALAAGFSLIRTVEKDEALATQAAARIRQWQEQANSSSKPNSKQNTRIQLWLGSSADMLYSMMHDLDKPAVILLDAHPSGPGTAGHEEVITKDRQSPCHQHHIITGELKVIIGHPIKNHLIIIDDQHGPNADNEKYRKMLKRSNPLYQFSFIGPADCPDKMLLCHPGMVKTVGLN